MLWLCIISLQKGAGFLSNTDLLVCRSGALTVSEVSAAGVGAIFIPFMHKDRQQALNADHDIDLSV